MKILLVKLSALGDVVQSLPVAMAIRRQRPDAVIDWLVEAPSAGLLEGHPALDRVIVSPRHHIKAQPGETLPLLGGFLGRLRARRYDAVVDLQGLMKSAILVRLSRGGVKIGFKGGKEPLAALSYTHKLAAYDPERHALERYLDLLEPLGLERPARPEFGLEPKPRTLAQARALWPGEPRGPLVLLHPVAKWDSKLWPEAHWARLIQGLWELGVQPALTGSPADREATTRIRQASGLEREVWDLAGATDLPTLAALLGLADAVVATDTGVMHLAAAVGVPVVSLFGPTAPWRTGPHGQLSRALRLETPCAPCFKRVCPHPRCLTELGPDLPLEAVRRIVWEKPSSPVAPGPGGGSTE